MQHKMYGAKVYNRFRSSTWEKTLRYNLSRAEALI